MAGLYRRLRAEFYRGPVDLGIPIPRRKGYQSPTVTGVLWLYAFGVRYFTMPGRAVLTVLGLILPFGMISLQMPVYILAFVLLSLFVTNVLAGAVVRPKLRLVRQLPSRVTVGAEIAIAYQVTNTGRRPCFDLHLDSLPWPAKVKLTRGQLFVPDLGPGEAATGTAWFTAERRGIYLLPAMRADSAFPFYLSRWGVSDDSGPVPLLVYPRFTPLQHLHLPLETRLQPAEFGRHFGPGCSHEFAGTREFRNGDHPRQLHWRSWARAGYPVVKEFRDYHQIKGGLLLDPHRALPWYAVRLFRKEDPVLEAGVALAAAVADYFRREGLGLEMFSAHRGPVESEALCDYLACAHGNPADNEFDRLAESLAKRAESVRFFLVVLLNWNETRERHVRQWFNSGLPCRVFLVHDGRTRLPASLPGTVTVIHAAALLGGQCLDL